MLQSNAPVPFQVAGVAGSLRQGSDNQALLRAAQQLAPVAVQIRIHDLSEIPLFNEDIEGVGIPAAVARLREAVAEADGFLVATPEYNHGVPGVMKNTFDWLSRQRTKNFGRKSLEEIKATLITLGLGLSLDLHPKLLERVKGETKEKPKETVE